MRSARRDVRLSQLIVGLLSAALLVIAGLAYQAVASEQSRREAAEQATRDHTTFATWQVGSHLQTEIISAAHAAFGSGSPFFRTDGSAVSIAQFAASIEDASNSCGCLAGVDAYLRVNPMDGTVTFVADSGSEIRAVEWGRQAILRHVRAPRVPHALRTEGYLRPSSIHRHGVTSGGASGIWHTTLYGAVDTMLAVVVFATQYDGRGRAIHAIGFVADARAFIAPFVARVLANTQLLPPSVGRGKAPSTLLRAELRAPAGELLFRHASTDERTQAGVDSFPTALGGLRLRVALEPEVTRDLVQSADTSRLSLILAMFAIAVGLLFATLSQWRRQHEFLRTRSDFIATVSHELRTPLAQIRLRTDLLRIKKTPSAEALERSLAIIDKEARRLSYLVDNVLAFAKFERGTQRVSRQPMLVRREIADIVEQFRPLAESAGSTVEWHVPGDLAGLIDPGAFRQIALNLLDNAVRHGRSVQTIRMTVGADAEGIVLVVEDEGSGVPAEERARIWEPYYQISGRSTDRGGGTGLGLAVVSDLVERHGGRAWVEDGAQGGARFVVVFPHVESPPASTSEHAQEPKSGGEQR